MEHHLNITELDLLRGLEFNSGLVIYNNTRTVRLPLNLSIKCAKCVYHACVTSAPWASPANLTVTLTRLSKGDSHAVAQGLVGPG